MNAQGQGEGGTVTLQPRGAHWARLVRRPPSDSVTRTTRAALGLPEDRPVAMGGHQPGLWHPGILAKWFALAALGRGAGAAPAWVVVDQSPGAGAEFPYPAREKGALVRRAVRLGRPDAPAAALPPARFDPPTDGATDAVQAGIQRLADLLRTHAGEATLARQLHAACVDEIAGIGGAGAPVASFFATELSGTPAFAELVGAMRADPDACAKLYNEAAAEMPAAGVRPLALTGGAVELPLWDRTSTPEHPGPWRTVTSDRLADLPDARLALRGLPMTGLLRRWACDLFVHGTGGGGDEGYDRVTEAWFASWLGARDLAPMVVASATLRLEWDGAGEDLPSPEDIARARDEAHRAEHDPAVLGDDELGRRKRELAAQIQALGRGDPKRAELFSEMQSLRERAAQEHGAELAELRARAESLGARQSESEIAADRTWPFVLHRPESLAALRAAITDELLTGSRG